MPTTRWTLVVQANGVSEEARSVALETLCRSYWYPLYSFVRRKGYQPEDAKDLIQSFFAHMLAGGRGGLGSAQQERGRFRSFLLVSLQNFLSDQWDRERALKRGGGRTLISIDEQYAEGRYVKELPDELDPAALFEWQWAKGLLAEVYADLEAEYRLRGEPERYRMLRGHLQEGKGDLTYTQIGARLGLSESAVTQEAKRMRERFGQLLWRRIRDTVESESDVEAEITDLIRVAGRC